MENNSAASSSEAMGEKTGKSDADTAQAASLPKKSAPSGRGGAAFVAAGIFLSRIAGLIRERVFAHYFGNSDAADAFKAALKIPNFLQNLFGEGVLSASFIPVYAKLLGEKNEIEADRVAGVIATLLALVTSALALIGVLFTPHMIDVIAPGFEGEKRELTIHLVQILFPGVALLVMSAWCLGILNSHRRFFLSYVAPVVWNFAIIGALLGFGGKQTQAELAATAAWGLVLGSFLQFAVQMPTVLKLMTKLRPAIDLRSPPVRAILISFSSVVIARGVVQISAYIDNVLASLLPTGAVSALAYAQTLYLLPISLFGMSVSAANLPEMARARGESGEANAKLREHLDRGLKQIAFFIVPSMAAFLFLGDALVAALYKTGQFSDHDVKYVWATLAGSAVGLLASALGRLYASTFYALQDARSPLNFALLRVALTTVLGYMGGVLLPGWLGIDSSWGVVGLTATAGMSGWIEFLLLRKKLNRRIGDTGVPMAFTGKLWFAAGLASTAAFGTKYALASAGVHLHPILLAIPVFGIFGVVYFGVSHALGIQQAKSFTNRILRLR